MSHWFRARSEACAGKNTREMEGYKLFGLGQDDAFRVIISGIGA